MNPNWSATTGLLLLSTATITAIDVETRPLPGPENEGASYSYVAVCSKRLMLPLRTHVTNIVHDKDKTVWAINYHETSDYDGVDIVIAETDKIFVVPNFWDAIQMALADADIIDVDAIDRLHLQIMSISDHTLRCRLTAKLENGQPVDRLFEIRIRVTESAPKFDLVR